MTYAERHAKGRGVWRARIYLRLRSGRRVSVAMIARGDVEARVLERAWSAGWFASAVAGVYPTAGAAALAVRRLASDLLGRDVVVTARAGSGS